jgi:hypothetical protein
VKFSITGTRPYAWSAKNVTATPDAGRQQHAHALAGLCPGRDPAPEGERRADEVEVGEGLAVLVLQDLFLPAGLAGDSISASNTDRRAISGLNVLGMPLALASETPVRGCCARLNTKTRRRSRRHEGQRTTRFSPSLSRATLKLINSPRRRSVSLR